MNRSLMNFLLLSVLVLLTAVLAFSQQTEVVGTPWYGGKGVTESVDQIMARQALMPTVSEGEREGPEMPLRPTPAANPDA